MSEREAFLRDCESDYRSYPTLIAAAADPDAAVVVSGDYGSATYLVAPVRHVHCDLDRLVALASDLDALGWMCADLAGLDIERRPIGTRVFPARDAPAVLDGVWVHPTGMPALVVRQAREVVDGRRDRIDADLLHSQRAARLARRMTWRTEHGLAGTADDITEPAVPFPAATDAP